MTAKRRHMDPLATIPKAEVTNKRSPKFRTPVDNTVNNNTPRLNIQTEVVKRNTRATINPMRVAEVILNARKPVQVNMVVGTSSEPKPRPTGSSSKVTAEVVVEAAGDDGEATRDGKNMAGDKVVDMEGDVATAMKGKVAVLVEDEEIAMTVNKNMGEAVKNSKDMEEAAKKEVMGEAETAERNNKEAMEEVAAVKREVMGEEKSVEIAESVVILTPWLRGSPTLLVDS